MTAPAPTVPDPVIRPPAYCTYGEGAIYTRLSERTLRRAVGTRRLRAFRVGARVVLSYEDLDRFVRGEPSAGGLFSLDRDQRAFVSNG